MKLGVRMHFLTLQRDKNLIDPPAMVALDVTPPAPGKVQKLADDLYWIRFTLPFRLNHINLFALDTDKGWLLLDCGIKSNATAAEWQAILNGPLAGKPVAGIVVSHYHADHIGYAGALAAQTGAPIYMGAVEHEQAVWGLSQSDANFAAVTCNAYKRFGLSSNHIRAAQDAGNYYRFLTGDLPEVNIIDVAHKFNTVAGSWTVRFDAGHSPGHMSLTDRIRKIYICVDFLLPRISPNISAKLRDIDNDILAKYLHYLRSMTQCPQDWLIVPGHDWPYYGGGVRAQQLLLHHEARLDQLHNIIEKKAVSTNDAMLALFPFEMTNHEVFFASCEARAHLTHLVTLGRITQTPNSSGVDIFVKC